MSSYCRRFRTSKPTRFAKLLIAQERATVSKRRQVRPFASLRNNKHIRHIVTAAWRCCFQMTVDAAEFSALELFVVFLRVRRKELESGRCGSIAGNPRNRSMRIGVNSKFYNVHCRTFETLRRSYILSYTGAQNRTGIPILGAGPIAGSGPLLCFGSHNERRDCDRVNGRVGPTRSLLQLAQMVRWYAFGCCSSEMDFPISQQSRITSARLIAATHDQGTR